MNITGLRFDNVTMQEAVNRVLMMAQRRDRARYVCTGNLDHLRLANEDPEFFCAYWDADLVVADGTPVVWLSKLLGKPLKERVTGIDLFRNVCAAAGRAGLKVFLLGGLPGSAEKAREVFEAEYPGINIVGSVCPPHESFDSEVTQRFIRESIKVAKPDILFVGLGAPKQEKWISENVAALKVPVSIGVGGAFEMVAGVRKRAPKWMQRVGLEWFYRFAQEPRRLFDRYFRKDMPFLLKAAAHSWVSRHAA